MNEAEIGALKLELAATRDQRNNAMDQLAAVIAQANAQIGALQERIKELTAQPKQDSSK